MMPIEVLGQHGIFAVRHAILSQVTGTHVCSHDFEVAAGEPTSCSFRETESETCALRLLKPSGFRVALPLTFSRFGLNRTEVKQSCLLTGVRFDLEGSVVLPS